MTWNYRLVHRFDTTLEEDIYAIHEAYYDEGKDEPHSIGENPSWPQGATWEEFLEDFAHYQASSLYPRKRILEYADFDKTNHKGSAPIATGEGREYFNQEHLERVREAREEKEIIEARQTVRPINGEINNGRREEEAIDGYGSPPGRG